MKKNRAQFSDQQSRLIAILFLTASVSCHADFLETFDGIDSYEQSAFNHLLSPSQMDFSIDSLSTNQGAILSNTLPCAAQGDQELRSYYSGSGLSSGILVANDSSYNDMRVSGYVGTGILDSWGSKSAGLMTRVTYENNLASGYITYCQMSESTMHFGLGIMKNGTVHATNILSWSESYSFSPDENNLYVQIDTLGTSISATYWRVNIDGSHSFLETLSGQSDAYDQGYAGIYSFTRGPNSIFFDDIEVQTIPEPSTFSFLLISGTILYTLRNKLRR